MVLCLLTGTFVDYEAKNQQKIWNDTQIFVKKDVIFNKSRFWYKNKPNSKLVGENTSIDLVILAGIFKPVGKGHRVGLI